jgi:hypothetical protein
MKLKLAPGKVAVKKIEAKLKGVIGLPPSRTKSYDLGQIVDTGDLSAFGHERKNSTAEIFKKGDVIIFQLPQHLANLICHRIKGELLIFLNVADIIGRLKSDVIDIDNFQIASKYILLKPTIREVSALIVVPASAEEMNKESLSFSVAQKGVDVSINIFKGQEVFPHKGRLSPIIIENEEFAFIDQDFIDGVMAEN